MLRALNTTAVRGLRESIRSFRTMAPRRLDFNALSEKLTSAEARAELDAFRRTHNDVLNHASTTAGIVDSFKKASESLAPQTMNNPYAAELEENFAALIKEAEAAKAFSEGQIVELEAKLHELETAGDITKVTIAEEAAKYPELVAEIEAEISNHEWFK